MHAASYGIPYCQLAWMSVHMYVCPHLLRKLWEIAGWFLLGAYTNVIHVSRRLEVIIFDTKYLENYATGLVFTHA